MGLIEQAARRIEELRQAGITVPSREPEPAVAPAREGERRTARGTPRLKVDLAGLAANGYVTPDNPRARIAEEFRVIKRPLITNASAERTPRISNGNLIMVTSALPGEGKSFTVLNLAMSIAMEMNHTVLLVDADVVRPSLPRTLGVPDSPGLLDLLERPSLGVESVLHRTNIEKLTFISSGSPSGNAAEALAGDAMTKLLEEIGSRYPDRIILFDSPPLLVTSEARVLANRMGQVIFVVDAEGSKQGDVVRALATIDAVPIKLMLLNRGRADGQAAYGYGYGYGE